MRAYPSVAAGMVIWAYTSTSNIHVYLIINTVPADALAPLGSQASAGTVLRKYR